MSGTLVTTPETASLPGTVTLASLIGECEIALSRNTPTRWSTSDMHAAFIDGLRACQPLGMSYEFEGPGEDDGVWFVPYHVTRLLRLRLGRTFSSEFMEVPIGAVKLSTVGPTSSRISLPYGCASDVQVKLDAMVAVPYNTVDPSVVVQFPWPELVKYYMLAALYEQRVDLTTMSDAEGYMAGMTTWRTRADIRKAELMTNLGMMPTEQKAKR